MNADIRAALDAWQRFRDQGRPSDLDACLAALRRAATSTAGGPEARGLARIYVDTAQYLRRLFDEYRTPLLLEANLECYERGLELGGPAFAHAGIHGINISSGYLDRFSATGDAADLDRALATLDRARKLLKPTESYALHDLFLNIGNVHRLRYERTGAAPELRAAIDAYERGLGQPELGARDRAVLRSRLAIVVRSLARATGDPRDLDRAISEAERALAEAAPNDPGRAGYANEVAVTRADRARATGRLSDLETVLGYAREAVRLVAPGSPDQALYLANLGGNLCERFALTGDLADLDHAINCCGQAVRLTPERSIDRPRHLRALALALVERWHRTQQMDDLLRGGQLHEEARALIAPGNPEYPVYLENSVITLLDLYGARGEPAILADASRLLDELVALPAPSACERARRGQLVLYVRSEQGKPLGLAEAEEAARAAEGTPLLPMALNNLATVLAGAGETERARAAYRRAVETGRALSYDVVIGAGRNWGRWAFAAGRWDEAAEAYRAALDAAAGLRATAVARVGKQVWLATTQRVAERLAFALAKQGRLEEAVVALESSRAVLLTEALEREGADLAGIAASHPGVHGRFVSAARRMSRLEAQLRPGALAPSGDLTGEAATIRRELADALAAVRAVPGHERFLGTPSLADVQAAVRPGRALAFLVTTDAGSLALLVHAGGVAPVWLDLTVDRVRLLLYGADDGAGAERGKTGGYLRGLSRGNVAWVAEAVKEWAALAGPALMAPLVAELQARGASEVVLVPCGFLANLPLHAASGLPDDLTITYAPNARTFASVACLAREPEAMRWLGVGNPAPHPHPLPAAELELAAIRALLPADQPAPLVAEAATRAAVLAALPGATHLHFACHGVFRWREPLASELQLAGGESITLADLLDGEARLGRTTRLAVLSACQTALTDFDRLPDELIGLPAGLLQAGVTGVVGTLWSVDDLSAYLLLTAFYRFHLTGDRLPPPRALARAQRWLREVSAGELMALCAALEESCPDLAAEAGMRFEGRPAGTKPFAESPYHWAAFVYLGA